MDKKNNLILPDIYSGIKPNVPTPKTNSPNLNMKIKGNYKDA
jgi:hypothetical protein